LAAELLLLNGEELDDWWWSWDQKLEKVARNRANPIQHLAGMTALGLVSAGWARGHVFEGHFISHGVEIEQFIGKEIDPKAYGDLSRTAQTSGLYRERGGAMEQFLVVRTPSGQIGYLRVVTRPSGIVTLHPIGRNLPSHIKSLYPR
jgi:hypothetical protein